MRIEILRERSAARQVLDGLQDQILEVHKAIRTTELALLPSEETRARLRSAFQHQVFMHTPENSFAEFQQLDNPAKLPAQVDFALLLHVLGIDAVLDLVMKRLGETTSKSKPAILSEAKRAEKLRELRAQLDQLERAEELETLRLEDAGNVILRRREARPEILFQVWAERA